MYILGINAYHGDSSACITKDGAIVTARKEENRRFIAREFVEIAC